MNLYGDHGNILTLVKRCEWRGIKTKVIEHEPGQSVPKNVDIIFGGGGQDSGQNKIEADLKKIAPELKKLVEAGTPTLVICGLYQLFGKYFLTQDEHRIEGIGILNLSTTAGPERLIGNIVIKSNQFGQIVGYENHSGLTTLEDKSQALGEVVSGAGNNGEDQTEGCFYKNCIGTYLHGPILPKNPKVADFLIETALKRQNPKFDKLTELDDSIEKAAHRSAVNRPR
jgi:CobQ-like glutamine amidotransferase family enzyme